jgi:hypothetical protein
MTQAELATLVRGLAPVVKEMFTERDARIALLENHVAELREGQTELKYVGVWLPETQYRAGNFCTESGHIWHANCDSRGVKPAVGAGWTKCWTLACKAGRDGKRA